jgi:hypothetical protein
MSNRNFDSSVITKRLRDKNYARNLYNSNINGKTLIGNPQASDGTSGRYNTYIPGAQTEYFRGLLGGQVTVNIGGSIITPASNQSLPTVLSSTDEPLPNETFVTDINEIFTISETLDAPILTYILPANNGAYVYFTPGTVTGTAYHYTTDAGNTYKFNPSDTLSPIYIPNLINGNTYNIQLRTVNTDGESSQLSNILTVIPNNSSIPDAQLFYDPNNISSYSGTGPSVNNIGIYGTLNGTKGASVLYEDDTTISRKIFNFSGANGNANLITFPIYNFGTQISATAWIYPREKQNINGLLANTTANVQPNGFKFQWNWWMNGSRTIGMQAGNSEFGGDNFTVQNTINYGEWQHIGYVFDQLNRKIIFFKNGIPIDMLSGIEPVENIGTNQAFNIGGYIGGSYTMNAKLGYIKVFNTLLNASEILSDFNNSKSQFGL